MTDLEKTQAFASALDREEYEVARQWLSDVTAYRMGDDIILGVDSILASYKDNGDWAKENLEKIEYASDVQAGEDGYLITYTDTITIGNHHHTYQCQQWVEFGEDGLIARIEHREIPGLREELLKFLEECGVER